MARYRVKVARVQVYSVYLQATTPEAALAGAQEAIPELDFQDPEPPYWEEPTIEDVEEVQR